MGWLVVLAACLCQGPTDLHVSQPASSSSKSVQGCRSDEMAGRVAAN